MLKTQVYTNRLFGFQAMNHSEKTELSLGRITGAVPAENRYYVLILFDISETKKYTCTKPSLLTSFLNLNRVILYLTRRYQIINAFLIN